MGGEDDADFSLVLYIEGVRLSGHFSKALAC